MKYDVACVGISCADVLAKPVSTLPGKGRLGLIDHLQMQIGGCAANAAIDLARIGMRSAFVGKVGCDGFGKFIASALSAENVDITGLRSDDSVQTAASVVTISADGERSILHCLGSNARFAFEDVDLDVVRSSKILLVAGTFLMPLFDGAGTKKLLQTARAAGVTCCLDTAWDSTGRWMATLDGALEFLDWFMPSYEEAAAMSGKSDPADIADIFLAAGVKNVIIKLGKDGCYLKEGESGESFVCPTYSGVKVVDTSGAGDSFCAGFLTGLVMGWDNRRSARFANAVGSHCVMEIGTTAGIKPMKDILEFMEREK